MARRCSIWRGGVLDSEEVFFIAAMEVFFMAPRRYSLWRRGILYGAEVIFMASGSSLLRGLIFQDFGEVFLRKKR